MATTHLPEASTSPVRVRPPLPLRNSGSSPSAGSHANGLNSRWDQHAPLPSDPSGSVPKSQPASPAGPSSAHTGMERLNAGDGTPQHTSRTLRTTWSPSPLTRQLYLEDDLQLYPQRFSQDGSASESHQRRSRGPIDIPRNFIRSFSPSNDSVHTSSSFTRSAAPISLFGDDTDVSDAEPEAVPLNQALARLHATMFASLEPTPHALGIGFDDTDLDLSFEDSPIVERRQRASSTARSTNRSRSPSLRHVGRLSRKELGTGSGSEAGSIIGLSSPEASPMAPSFRQLVDPRSRDASQDQNLPPTKPANSYFTPKLGATRLLGHDETQSSVPRSTSDRTPSADQRRTPRSTSASAVPSSSTIPPLPPLPLLRTKPSLSTGSIPALDSMSTFRSPSTRPTLLPASARSSKSPRSPDSSLTDAPTPTAEDYDAGESAFSSLTGASSSRSGSSSMLAQHRGSTSTIQTSSKNSPDIRPSRGGPSSMLHVYSDLESESEGFGGLVGLRQASTVSERWDEDFLFQEETEDDQPQSRSRTKRKSRRRERQPDKRIASAPVGETSQRGIEPSAALTAGSHGASSHASRAADGHNRTPQIPTVMKPQDADGPFSDNDDGLDDTMRRSKQNLSDDEEDDDDEDDENWDGEISMLSGSSVGANTLGGKMTASSSARTIIPATPANLLMTSTSSRMPSAVGEKASSGLGSRRVTPKASKKSSVARLQQQHQQQQQQARDKSAALPVPRQATRRPQDEQRLQAPRAKEEDGATSGSSSQDDGGLWKATLSSSGNSHRASVSSKSSGTVARLRTSMISTSTDDTGSRASGGADSLHKKAAGSIASTDFSARLAAQSEISSWRGNRGRPGSRSDRADSGDEMDFSQVEVREDPIARQPRSALEAETRAQTQERARAWVEESSRELDDSPSTPFVRRSSGKRKQPSVVSLRQGSESAAEDTETEERNGYDSMRIRSADAQRVLGPPSISIPGRSAGNQIGQAESTTQGSRSPTQGSLAGLLSFNGKKLKHGMPSSPAEQTPSPRQTRTNPRVNKLAGPEAESRPESRASSTSSRSPESKREKIKKLLVQQRKQRKVKSEHADQAYKSPEQSPSIPTSPLLDSGTRRRTRSQNGRSKLSMVHGASSNDSANTATPPLPTSSPARAASPFGRGWGAFRSATATSLHKPTQEGHTQGETNDRRGAGAKDEGLPVSSSAGALNAVRSSDATQPERVTETAAAQRPRHGRTGSSLSISFGINRAFASSSSKSKVATPGSAAKSAGGESFSDRSDRRQPQASPPLLRQDSSHEASPSSSPSARVLARRQNQPIPVRHFPSTLPMPSSASAGHPPDCRSVSNSSTALTHGSSGASSDFWAQSGEGAVFSDRTSPANGRRMPSSTSSNTTTPTLGSPESAKFTSGSRAGFAAPVSQSRRSSAAKTSVTSSRCSQPSTSPELPYTDLMPGPPPLPQGSGEPGKISDGMTKSRNLQVARPSGILALKSTPEDPIAPTDPSRLATTTDSPASKLVIRRNSLSDLKIPTRISRAQDGIRANMTYLRDFAHGITELKTLQARYHAALLELHRYQDQSGPKSTRSKELLGQLGDIELLYAPWWECADVLIGLGDGRSDADRSATLDTLTHSPAPRSNRDRRITLNTPPRPMQSSYVSMSKELSSDASGSLASDTSSSGFSVRRTDPASAVSRASSMSGRQVAAQREMDILSIMLAGQPLDSSFYKAGRDSATPATGSSQPTTDESVPSSESGHHAKVDMRTETSLTFAAPPTPRSKDKASDAPSQGPYQSNSNATASMASVAAVSTDSFAHLNSLDPDKSGRRKVRNASKAGLQGLRELLRSFKLSSNAETELPITPGPDSAASTPADDPDRPLGVNAEAPGSHLDAGATRKSKFGHSNNESLGRPQSAQGAAPSPTRRRSKIFGIVTAGLSNSRLDVIPSRSRVISAASSSAQSSTYADGPDNSADSGWTQPDLDAAEAMRASVENIRLSTQAPLSPASGGNGSNNGTRHRLFSLGRQLIGSRPRGDSVTSKSNISPANLSMPLPAVGDESVSPGGAGDSGFSLASSSVSSSRNSERPGSSMGPPSFSDQLTLGRRQGDRIQMNTSGMETIRRSSGLSASGEARQPTGGLRPSEPQRAIRGPTFGRSFSASPSPSATPSSSLQHIHVPSVPPLPPPMMMEGNRAKTRDTTSSMTGTSLGAESWGSLGSDSDVGPAVEGDPGATPMMGSTARKLEGRAASALATDLSGPRPTTASDAAAMSRFRKLILRPDAIRSLLAYVQATKNNCDTALAEVSQLASEMEGQFAEGGPGAVPRAASYVAAARESREMLREEGDEEKEKEVLRTIRSPSSTTPKRRSVLPAAAF